MSRQRPLTSSWLAVPTTAIVTLGRKSEGVREIRDWRWHATSTKGIIIIVYVLMYKNSTIVLPSDTAILG